MTTDKRLDEMISRWLEESAQGRVPERVLDATFERTRSSRQQVGWRGFLRRSHIARFAPAIGGAAVVVMATAVALNFAVGLSIVGGPPRPFVGDWQNDEDGDGSHQTMEVIALPDGTFGVTIRDDLASVCRGASSTMTGVAEEREPDTLVIAQPEFGCDDGSRPEALSGPPLEEQLQNFGFDYDPDRDELQDSFGAVWIRVLVGPGGAAIPSGGAPAPTPTQEPGPPAPSDGQPTGLAGSWESEDMDGSHQTMEVIALPDGTYSVTILDDLASVCGGVPSTLTGVGEAGQQGELHMLLIAQPEYVCDDGSRAEALSGPPLDQQLRDLIFTYDQSLHDELGDSLGLVWSRVVLGA